MAENIVVGYGNGVQLFQRKAIIDLDRANDHSATGLIYLHIQPFYLPLPGSSCTV